MKAEVNTKIGRLTILERIIRNLDKSRCYYKCLCDCGNIKFIRNDHLHSGRIQSCGCFQKESVSRNFTTHGQSTSAEYACWCHMKQRCYDSTTSNYNRYGGRGIKVCDRWLNSFENFLEDMGERPSNKHSLDRIDNNGDYTPENCRWATNKIQTRNTKRTKFIEFNGESKSVSEWAEIYNLNPTSLWSRLKLRWPIEKALLTPIRGN